MFYVWLGIGLGLADLGRREALHRAVDHAEALYARALLAAREERLHAEADAQERPVRLDVRAQRLLVVLLAQHLHALPERADAREQEHLRRGDLLRARDEVDLEAELLERVDERAHVPSAVVEE
eukprot:scaffold106118_cov54-Phaeocystis_antarctica.AAC.1